MPARNHIDLTVKTMNVLEALVQTTEGASLKDIAGRLGLVKSSVFRILYTLKELGYVEQANENGLYRITFKTTGLIRRSLERPSLASIVHGHLVRLRDAVHESVWLAELRRHGVVLTDVVEASHRLKLSFDVGDLCPVHATALGKVIAAHLAPEQLEALLPQGKLPRITRNTITSRAALRTELQRVREKGYAVNAEETIEGAIVVGAPLFDAAGKAFAAISVTAPTARCGPAKRKKMIEQVLAASRLISRELRETGFRAAES